MKRLLGGLLIALALTPALHAKKLSFEELGTTDGFARKDLGEISAPAFRETLDLLEREQGITARADAIVTSAEAAGDVLITELDDPRNSARRLFLFFPTHLQQPFFLQLQPGPNGLPEMRLWADGPSEILISRDEVRLLPAPSDATFRLSPRISNKALSTWDTITCIARTLGISLDNSSLASRLASTDCSATSSIALVLTACNCLSIFGIGTNDFFATLGCANGIAKLISCGYVNCVSSTCPVTTIFFSIPVSSSWSSSCGSTHRSGSFAKFYSFLLTSTTTVTIDLTSSSADAFLFLLQGSGTGGAIITSNDNGAGGTNARIIRTLPPGSYTIEATTTPPGRTGSFTLTLRR